jgi:hypothetical protein
MKPALHHDFQIDDYVSFLVAPDDRRFGTVVGVSTQHIIFTYIILLDIPMHVDDHDRPWRAVTMSGGQLELQDG